MQAIQKSVRQVARQPVGARAIQTRGALQTKAGDWMQGPLGYDTKFDKTLNTEVEWNFEIVAHVLNLVTEIQF